MTLLLLLGGISMRNLKLEKTIPITKDMYKDIKSLAEFYVAVGLSRKYIDNSGQERITQLDVTLVGMNSTDCNELRVILYRNNYKKGKLRYCNKQALDKMIGWEMLCYAPYSIDPRLCDEPDIHESGLLYLYEGWDKPNEN